MELEPNSYSLVPRPPPSLCPLQYEKWGEPGNEATDQWAAVLVTDFLQITLVNDL